MEHIKEVMFAVFLQKLTEERLIEPKFHLFRKAYQQIEIVLESLSTYLQRKEDIEKKLNYQNKTLLQQQAIPMQFPQLGQKKKKPG